MRMFEIYINDGVHMLSTCIPPVEHIWVKAWRKEGEWRMAARWVEAKVVRALRKRAS